MSDVAFGGLGVPYPGVCDAVGVAGPPEVPVLLAVLLAPIQVDASPTSSGMPGAGLIQNLLNWLSQLALWGSLASILCGAAVYGLASSGGNYAGAYRGKQLAVAGAVGAILAGIGPTAVNLLFSAAS